MIAERTWVDSPSVPLSPPPCLVRYRQSLWWFSHQHTSRDEPTLSRSCPPIWRGLSRCSNRQPRTWGRQQCRRRERLARFWCVPTKPESPTPCASWWIRELQHLDELRLITPCAHREENRQNSYTEWHHKHCFPASNYGLSATAKLTASKS